MRKSVTFSLVAGILVFGTVQLAQAATEVQKQAAIDKGLEWVAQRQQGDGRWQHGYYSQWDVGVTGTIIKTFIEKGYTVGNDVIINSTNYGDILTAGLNFIFSQTQRASIGEQQMGDPDVNGNGLGVYFPSASQFYTFSGSFAVQAIVLSDTPSAVVTVGTETGRTYFDVVQDIIDYFSWSQTDPSAGPYRGGWRYNVNDSSSDQELAVWPALAMMVAEQNWGITVPQFVKDELKQWMSYIQYTSGDGGAGYTNPGTFRDEAHTAGLLIQMLQVQTDLGSNPYDPGHANVQMAFNFLNNYWQRTYVGIYDGHFGHPYAMWRGYIGLAGMIGLEDTTYIVNLHSPGTIDPGDTWNWYEDYCEYLVNNQYADGHWYSYISYWGDALATAWYVDILQADVSSTISGYVYKAEGGGLEDVVVTADGQDPYITGPDGYYEIEVPNEWSGTVTPSKNGWSFEPTSRTYSSVTASQAQQNYTAYVPSEAISWSVTQLTTNGDNDSPRVSGSGIAWRNYDRSGPGDYEVFYHNGSANVQVTDNDVHDYGPDIEGTTVVWGGADGTVSPDADTEVKVWSGSGTTSLTSNDYSDNNPLISGSYIVWKAWPGTGNVLRLYNGSSTIDIPGSGDASAYQIDGNRVVWHYYDGEDAEIFYYDGSTTTQLTNNSTSDFDPVIDGNIIAWYGGSGSSQEIYIYDISTAGPVTAITNNSTSDQLPDISGNYIVWRGWDGSDYEIFYYNLVDGTTHQVTDNAYPDSHDAPPKIGGSLIVWEAKVDGSTTEIAVYDILTRQSYQLTSNGVWDRYPETSGQTIAWTTEGEIYKAVRAIHNSDKGQYYSSIQAAIDDADPCDTITVGSGTYDEVLTIDKALTLAGQDRDTTTIDGGGSSGDVIQVSANYVNISGFTVTGAGGTGNPDYDSGVRVSNAQHCRIEQNRCTGNNRTGIYVENSNNNTIIDNDCSANDYYGIRLSWADYNTVQDNTCTDNSVGIYLTGASSENDLIHNTYLGSGNSAIMLDSSSNNNTIAENTCSNCSNQGEGIRVHSSTGNTLKDNTCDNNTNYGIHLTSASGCSIYRNTISNNGSYGVRTLSTTNTVVYHNNFLTNANHATDTNGMTAWDNGYPMGGNYWDTHSGPDDNHGAGQDIAGSDGIVDVVYTIDTTADYYPWSAPYDPRLKISGYVTEDTSGVADVAVTGDGVPGPYMTVGDGYYELAVPEGWSGTVTPAKDGWGFDPCSQSYSNVTGDQADQNFTAFELTVAPTETEKRTAIESGLEWLAQNQQADGRWLFMNVGNASYDCAVTSIALEAFLEAGYHIGSDVVIKHVNYGDVVGKGLNYVFNQAAQINISIQPAGNPDVNGNGIGVYFGPSSHSIYNTSMTLLALVATKTPEAVITTGSQTGRTYQDVIQDGIDYLAWGQNDSGSSRGGWRFTANQGTSGQENSPWACFAMLAAEQDMGLIVPQFVKSELTYWLNYIQYYNGSGTGIDGSSGFTYPTDLNSESKTGGLLGQMIFAGTDVAGTGGPYDLTQVRLLAAVDYLNREWPKDAYGTWYGNFGHPYAMIQMHKGLSLTIGRDDTTYITNFRDPDKIDPGETWTWSKDYERYQVDEQLPDGSWDDKSNSFYEGPLATAWGVNILNATTDYYAQSNRNILDFEDVADPCTGTVWMPPWTPYHDIESMGPSFMAYEVGYSEAWARSKDDAGGNPGRWSVVNWGGDNPTRTIVFKAEVNFHGAWFTWGQTDYLGNWTAAKWVQIVGKDKDGNIVGTTNQLTLDDTYQYLEGEMEGVKTLEITSFNDEYNTSYYQMDNLEYSKFAPGQIVAWGDNTYGQCDVPENYNYAAISCGPYHNLGLKADGSLRAWGWDNYNQCSDTPAGNDFVVIAAGGFHNLALRSDGSLVAWGYNAYGQCDVPSGNDFVAIGAGTYQNVAVRSDGSLVAWGDNSEGQCNVPAGNDFVDAGTGHGYGAALKSDGSLFAWGNSNPYPNPADIDIFNISAGGAQCMALKFNRSLAVFSDDAYGQISNMPAGNDFVGIGSAWLHCLAIRSDGSLEAWGYNDQGQCNVPGHDSYSAVAGGYYHSIALVGEIPDPRSIYLLDPNGSEALFSGETHTIKWGSFGDVSNVIIEYSTNNGSNWVPVDPPNTGNTGSYDWLVPPLTSEQCLVRISDPDHSEVFQDSSEAFGIYDRGAVGDAYISWYASNSVVQYDDVTSIKVGPFGPGATGPYDVEFGPGGNMFVGSYSDNCVLEHDGSTGALIGTFVPSGSGGLSGLRDMAFGPNGNLFVLSKNNKNIIEYDGGTGALVSSFVIDESNDPRAIAFSPKGKLMVASYRSHAVLEYDRYTGNFLRTVVSGGLLQYPEDLEFGPDGALYIASWSNRSVLRWDDPCSVLTTFVPTASGDLSCPEEIEFTPDGEFLYVADWYNHKIKRYNGSDGSYIDTFAAGDGELGYPSGLTFKPLRELRLLDPNGGDTLIGGDPYKITWEGLGGIRKVLIEFSSNNGSDWTIVEPNAPNTDISDWYDWLVPEGISSDQCLIRITDADDSNLSATSDSVFKVIPGISDFNSVEEFEENFNVLVDPCAIAGGTHSYSSEPGVGGISGRINSEAIGDVSNESTSVYHSADFDLSEGDEFTLSTYLLADETEDNEEPIILGMVGFVEDPCTGMDEGRGQDFIGARVSKGAGNGNGKFRLSGRVCNDGVGQDDTDNQSESFSLTPNHWHKLTTSLMYEGDGGVSGNADFAYAAMLEDYGEDGLTEPCEPVAVITGKLTKTNCGTEKGKFKLKKAKKAVRTHHAHKPNPKGKGGGAKAWDKLMNSRWKWKDRVRGDFNLDWQVDILDFAILSSAWLSHPCETGWKASYDISEPRDSVIDPLDLDIFVRYWLERRSAPNFLCRWCSCSDWYSWCSACPP